MPPVSTPVDSYTADDTVSSQRAHSNGFLRRCYNNDPDLFSGLYNSPLESPTHMTNSQLAGNSHRQA